MTLPWPRWGFIQPCDLNNLEWIIHRLLLNVLLVIYWCQFFVSVVCVICFCLYEESEMRAVSQNPFGIIRPTWSVDSFACTPPPLAIPPPLQSPPPTWETVISMFF